MSRVRHRDSPDSVVPKPIYDLIRRYGEHALVVWETQGESLTKITTLRGYLEWESWTAIGVLPPLVAQRADFVLRHGKEFVADAQTFKGGRMAKGRCFHNASNKALVDDQLTYVEGYVRVTYGEESGVPFIVPLHHAWLIDPDGKVLDPTLRPNSETGENVDYFGVCFNTDFLSQFVQLGLYGLLGGLTKVSRAVILGKIDGWGVS